MDYPVIDVTATGRNIGTMIRRSNYSVPDVADYLVHAQLLSIH